MTRFWVAVLLILGIGAGVLRALGPSPSWHQPEGLASKTTRLSDAPLASKASGPMSAPDALPVAHESPEANGRDVSVMARQPARPGRGLPGPVAGPDPAMLEPVPGSPNLTLPRIAVDGRTPMAAYAAGFDPPSNGPRVGLLIAGIGMSEADSLAAIETLPGGVTLAISAYAGDLGHLLEVARTAGHEYLLSIPMEPQGYPANDPDDRFALMTSLSPAENLQRLREVLARLTGYVGVTDALGQLHGERLAGVPDQLDSVLEEAAHRGLLFIDARTDQHVLAHAWNRPADMVIDDDPVDAAALDQRLDTLTRLALDKGSAVGIVSLPRPVTLERVAAWTNALESKGVVLAPVSALVLPPATQESETQQEPGK